VCTGLTELEWGDTHELSIGRVKAWLEIALYFAVNGRVLLEVIKL
jgi:hypothetical protein